MCIYYMDIGYGMNVGQVFSSSYCQAFWIIFSNGFYSSFASFISSSVATALQQKKYVYIIIYNIQRYRIYFLFYFLHSIVIAHPSSSSFATQSECYFYIARMQIYFFLHLLSILGDAAYAPSFSFPLIHHLQWFDICITPHRCRRRLTSGWAHEWCVPCVNGWNVCVVYVLRVRWSDAQISH